MSGPRPDERQNVREQWIVQGRVVADGSVEAAIAGNDHYGVVSQVAPDVLVLEMAEVHADQLKAKFGAGLLIERDRPVPEPRQPIGLEGRQARDHGDGHE